MASMDISALLLALIRIAEVLETANIIAMASYPDISTSSQPPSSSVPIIGVVPEVQVSTSGVEAASKFVPASNMTFSVRKEEGLEDIPFRCGRGVGEEGVEKMEDGFECQLSDHTVCDPCICSF